MAADIDSERMLRALQLAERGWGRVHPNPMVGAVVERDGEIVGEGWHAEFGGPHAEIVALERAGEAARGATLYVSLEPCNHHGKTPPCTDAILRAGIRRVVFAVQDPGPESAGGARRLRDAGIDVVEDVEHAAARSLNAAFFHLHGHSSPFVTLKLALSLDAKLTRSAGTPTRISGDEAFAEVHRLRAGFDAVMVGSGTALADDPFLTARGDIEPRKPPIRIVLDSRLRLPPTARLVRTIEQAPLWIFTREDAPADRARALESAGARILRLPAADHGIELAAALATLRAEGVHTIVCEGGARLATALVTGDWVSRLIVFYAPVLFGESAPATFAFTGIPQLAERDRWTLASVRRIGDDAQLTLDRAPREDWH